MTSPTKMNIQYLTTPIPIAQPHMPDWRRSGSPPPTPRKTDQIAKRVLPRLGENTPPNPAKFIFQCHCPVPYTSPPRYKYHLHTPQTSPTLFMDKYGPE